MKVVIEFYRIRPSDKACAIIGRETAEAADRNAAIAVALQLRETLDMPQRPDGMSIYDGEGNKFHSGSFDDDAVPD
ncbi:hypothetical protein [Prosthecodimorpha staleyi]|uniref:Uncharacterized protein n=1 Tax=Prosthecodimorpha staleyi TaxID=2840188 RepID=A0A947GDF3_9HYPH|nr:hypothetical protein [Prosthecodimorpha staleyi]MBT9292488.1 hypothetical protein [Prosthecodimorpha staleyi]